MERELKEFSGDYLVIPSGYFGIYERAYGIMGFGELMTNIGINPGVVHELLDKVTEQKVEFARRVVEMGHAKIDSVGRAQLSVGCLFSHRIQSKSRGAT